jgi:hypothetical protein
LDDTTRVIVQNTYQWGGQIQRGEGDNVDYN